MMPMAEAHIAPPILDLESTPEQRWVARQDRRRFFRERGMRGFDPSEFQVQPIRKEEGKAFVMLHHYSGSYPATRAQVGLFRAGHLVGVAAFSVPMTEGFFEKWLPGVPAADLGRFVLLDEVPWGTETWFLGQTFAMLPKLLPAVQAITATSDPVPRTTAAGEKVTPGHVGTIYQAHNGVWVGRTTPRMHYLDPLGRVLSPRNLQKARGRDQGWRYATEALVTSGAPIPHAGENPQDWVRRALQDGPFRRLKHAGNHVYIWPVHLKMRKRLSIALPNPSVYPKQPDEVV